MDVEKIFAFVRSEALRLELYPSSYAVGNDIANGSGEIIFNFRDGKWLIYISERGKETDFAYFDDAYSAIKYFFMRNLIDHENRIFPKIQFKDFPE